MFHLCLAGFTSHKLFFSFAGKEYFVCDFKGHCVVVFNEEGKFLRRIGCDNVTNFPNGIDISDAGDILIGDSHGNRFHVAVFSRDGSLISEFECPYVKVNCPKFFLFSSFRIKWLNLSSLRLNLGRFRFHTIT